MFSSATEELRQKITQTKCACCLDKNVQKYKLLRLEKNKADISPGISRE